LIDWQVDSRDAAAAAILPKMRTDVCLQNAENKIIMDCKYYCESLQYYYEKSTIHSNNLYQLFAYVKNKEHEAGWENCAGVLLYPAVQAPLDARFRVQGHPMRVRTVDLDQDWKKIKEDLLDIILNF